MKLYGFYSEKQASQLGFVVFETEDGSMVRITETVYDSNKPAGAWDDYIAMGEVIKLIQTYDTDGNPREPFSLKDFGASVDEEIEEVSDEDIITIKPSLLIHALQKDARKEWDKEASKITSIPSNPVFKASFAKYKQPPYQVN